MSLFDEDTALDNVLVALPATRKRSFDAWRDRARDSVAQDQAAAILGRVGLRGRERVRTGDLAYGERRALEIGLALATAPRILFLDEPTSGLGADGTARLTELVAELQADGPQPLGLPGVIPPNDGGLAAGQLAVAAARGGSLSCA